MKTKDFIREDYEEYNDEVGMVKNNLHTIARMCEVLDQHLDKDDNMAEWAQEKIAVVKSMIVTVTDYIISQHEQGIRPSVKQGVAEDASVGATASGAVATSMGGGAGFGKSIFMRRMPKAKKGRK